MSYFSQKLREHMESSGLSVYQLARLSGVERTSVHRFAGGTRLPSDEVLRQLSRALRLSIQEEQELQNLLHIERVGPQTYQSRVHVRRLLERICDTQRMELQVPPEFEATLGGREFPAGHMHALRSPREIDECISAMLRHMVGRGKPFFIYSNDVHKAELLYSLLRQPAARLCSGVCQFVQLVKPGKLVENLKTLERLLPYMLCLPVPYEVMYDYTGDHSTRYPGQLFPLYLVMGDLMLHMAADHTGGMLVCNGQAAQLVVQELERMRAGSRCLFRSQQLTEQVAIQYQQTLSRQHMPLCFYESWPCIGAMMDEEMLETMLQGQILEISLGILHSIQSWSNDHVHLFGMERMDLFVTQGIFPGFIGRWLGPFPPALRRRAMENFYRYVQRDSIRWHMLDPARLPMVPGLNIELYQGGEMILTSQSVEHGFSMMQIDEQEIMDAFADFIYSLTEEPLQVYSREETLQRLRAFIDSAPWPAE